MPFPLAGSSVSGAMDSRPLFQTLHMLAEDNAAFFRDSTSETSQRFLAAFTTIQEHARCLEPVLGHFATIYHLFDLDEQTPANGYRSLAQTVHCCLAHIIHKSRYVAANRRSIFFRTNHNCVELEAYCIALTQLRALVYLAQRLLTQNRPGYLFNHEERGLSEQFLREYITMQKGCFYGRCMGFQAAVALLIVSLSRDADGNVIQTLVLHPHWTELTLDLSSLSSWSHPGSFLAGMPDTGVAASSLFTSGKFAIDPELRGMEFERITQNLDVHFWKSFWNLTEMELLASLASIASSQVRLSRALLVPPHSFDLPLVADPKLTVTITPPVAHTGPGPADAIWDPWYQGLALPSPLHFLLLSLQDSEELMNLMRPEGTLALELLWKAKPLPRSPYLVVHFHGGGFVAQTSKSHEPYLKSWAQELGAPILSIDYSLAPEAPFPRALEECFYAYCWALKNCHLLGKEPRSTGQGGERHGSEFSGGTDVPKCFPFPLSVPHHQGMEPEPPEDPTVEKLGPVNMVYRDTALLFRNLRLSASSLFSSMVENAGKVNGSGGGTGEKAFCPAWTLLHFFSLFRFLPTPFLSHPPFLHRAWPFLMVPWAPSGPAALHVVHGTLVPIPGPIPYLPGSCLAEMEAGDTIQHSFPIVCVLLSSSLTPDVLWHTEPMRKSISEVGLKSKAHSSFKESRKTQTCQDLSCSSDTPPDPGHDPGQKHQTGFFLNDSQREVATTSTHNGLTFPDGFQPIRSTQPATSLPLELSPIVKNPFMSPLLAPDGMLRGLPPIHIVACALDPMLDDSVMFARRLRAIGQPVTLRVVQDLPHGFLSLSQLCRETRQATTICTELIRDILVPPDQDPPPPTNPPSVPTTASSHRKHRKLERTLHTGPATSTTSQSTHQHPIPEDTMGTGQERPVGAVSTEASAPSRPGGKTAASSQHLRRGSGSSGGPPNRGKEMPTPPSSPAPVVTPGQDSSPPSGTVGRGVGA
ncbi:hypothetical protein JD844_006118 [Phrynosoma platyrhinos]|uniref:Hormone-sensitive lipase n=1 Tax=Phrynosoma platyrhinos TaxID=52577 RepID=A0ABQ7TPU2_PHRPL|nr:hypothetical protein JD844_006118 [Phrynosoma platyrhinos]